MGIILLCPRCQKRNSQGAARCQYCGAGMAGAVTVGGAAAERGSMPAFRGGGRTSGLAATSLILGLLGLFTLGVTALVGLILGIAGLRQVQRSEGQTQGQGQGLAVAGIVVSGLVMTVMLFFVPIVAAILFPVFAQARERARTSVCMDRMHRVGLAMAMYEQDYDGHYPSKQSWCDDLLPYARARDGVPSASIFQCPSLPDQRTGQAYNAQLSGVSMNRIAAPADTVTVFDSPGGWNLAGGLALVAPRHGNAPNVLFADGHVQWMRSVGAAVWKPSAPVPSHHRRRHHRRRR